MPGFKQWRRFKKRAVIVALSVLAVVFLVSGLISWYAAALPGPADITRFSVSESENRQQVLGAGISLSGIKSANLVADSSFELTTVQTALTVQQAERHALSVALPDPADPIYQDDFFEGATAEVYAWEQNQIQLKTIARVERFGTNRIGRVQPLVINELQSDGMAIHDMVLADEHVWAVGERGLIIYDLTGSNRQAISISTEEDLVAIDFHPEAGFYACSRQGSVFYSASGFNWQRVEGQADFELRDIAVSARGIYVAVGKNGRILAGRYDLVGTFYYLQDRHNINTILYHNNQFLAAGDHGLLFSSVGGMIWRKEPYFEDTNWQTLYGAGPNIYIAGYHGKLVMYSDQGQYHEVQTGASHDIADIIVLSDGQLIATDRQGRIMTARQPDDVWQTSVLNSDQQIARLYPLDADRILTLGVQGSPGSAALVTEITLDRLPSEGVYQAGDLIYLKQTYDAFDKRGQKDNIDDETDVWQISGPGQISRNNQTAAPGGGSASLTIDRRQVADITPTLIYQNIQHDRDHFSRNDIYQFELWLRHEGDTVGSAEVWLSGSFDDQHMTFEYIGSEWKKYNFTFVMPAIRLTEDESVQINIAYSGKGALFIDRVFLGRAAENPAEIQRAQRSQIAEAKPAVIRFETLGIGDQQTAANSWSYPLDNQVMALNKKNHETGTANALNTALQLAYESNAEPWLVIDAYMSQEEINHLVEYLAAPISEPFGRIRQQNGSILPWTEQFGRIYLEFSDRHQTFQLDQHRAAYVNTMITAVMDSPYFARYKQHFVFIDGMFYDDGVMLSTADYHANDMQLIYTGDTDESISQTLQRYYHTIPRVPDRPTLSASSLKRTSYYAVQSQYPSMAWLTHMMLVDLGEQSALVNISLDLMSMTAEEQKLHQAVSKVISAASRGTPLDMQRISIADTTDYIDIGGENVSEQVYAYGFNHSDQISFVLINSTAERHDIQLISDLDIEQASMIKYIADGSVLSETTLKHNQQKIALMPGSVALIIKDK